MKTRVLGQEWKANVIRWQMTCNGAGRHRSRPEERPLIDLTERIYKALEACRRYAAPGGDRPPLPPGGRYENNDLAIFHEPRYQDAFVALWRRSPAATAVIPPSGATTW